MLCEHKHCDAVHITNGHAMLQEPSYELEIFFQGQWLEVLGCGVTQRQILEEAGHMGKTAWAFGSALLTCLHSHCIVCPTLVACCCAALEHGPQSLTGRPHRQDLLGFESALLPSSTSAPLTLHVHGIVDMYSLLL